MGEEKVRKIIFLDIDGVLASYDNIRLSGLLNLKGDEFGYYSFDLRCVGWLKWIIQKTGAEIVLSSSWKCLGLDKIRQMWVERDLPGDVIDITPDAKYENRGEEINKWLVDNKFRGNYVIIDDDSDMLPSQMEHFVQTNRVYGLIHVTARSVVDILNDNTLIVGDL